VILQVSANPEEVAVFLFENGRLRGPAGFSTMGMRIQNEQSGSTSLFAQPLGAVEAVVEEAGIRDQGAGISTDSNTGPAKIARGMLEARMDAALESLRELPARLRRRSGRLTWRCSSGGITGLRRGGRGDLLPDAEGRWPVKRCCARWDGVREPVQSGGSGGVDSRTA